MNASIEYQENCSVDLDINRIDSSCFNCVLVYRKTINRHPVCLLCCLSSILNTSVQVQIMHKIILCLISNSEKLNSSIKLK